MLVERRREYIYRVIFASVNIIQEFRVYDGALYPSSSNVRNIEVFFPLLSLFLSLVIKAALYVNHMPQVHE